MPNPHAQIEACLNAEQAALASCLALLEREREVLNDGEVESLESIAAEKNTLLAAMNQRSTEREQVLAGFGIPRGAAGVDTLLQAFPQFRPLWSGIAASARRARELNEINGGMIHARLNHTRQALSILAGPQQASTGFYGRDGQVRQAAPGRNLGSA